MHIHEELIEYITSCDRLVPRSAQWYELYLLGTKLIISKGEHSFPKPMSWNAGLEKKRKRLMEQIACAKEYEFLHEFDQFLRDPKLNWEQESMEKTRARNIGGEVRERINKYKKEAPKLFSLLCYVTSDNRMFLSIGSCYDIMDLGKEKQVEHRVLEDFPKSLILSGWVYSSDREKQFRLLDQIEYAYKHCFLDEMDVLIRSFKFDGWHYRDEKFMDELDLHEFQKSRKEAIFDNNKTTLISCFSKIRQLETTAEYYFNKEHMFCIYLSRLFNLFSIGADPLKALIQKNEEQLKEFRHLKKDAEDEPEHSSEKERQDYIQVTETTELLLSKLKIVHIMQQLDEKIDPDDFGEQFWDLLVERNICQEDYS